MYLTRVFVYTLDLVFIKQVVYRSEINVFISRAGFFFNLQIVVEDKEVIFEDGSWRIQNHCLLSTYKPYTVLSLSS